MRKTSGISSMLLIFLSLALITFSLLSLSSAKADKNLSEKSAQRTSEYYQADSLGNQILSDIDIQLGRQLVSAIDSAASSSMQESAYYQLCSGSMPDFLSSLAEDSRYQDLVYDWTYEESTHTIHFVIPVNDTQILQIVLEIYYPQEEHDVLYQIREWQVQTIADWNPDTSMKVYRLPDSKPSAE